MSLEGWDAWGERAEATEVQLRAEGTRLSSPCGGSAKGWEQEGDEVRGIRVGEAAEEAG